MTIKVLIIDDSALIRSVLSAIINQASDLLLVGAAPDAYVAKDMVIKLQPDVITLDIEMPKVDGLNFLEKLMKARPTPVIMISTLTAEGAYATLRSLELGAVDFMPKPTLNIASGMADYEQEIVSKIRAAAQTKPKEFTSKMIGAAILPIHYASIQTIVGIGASTGGTEAIRQILECLSPSFPAIVITQHMPVNFTKSFAQRLNGLCQMNVHEAAHGQQVLPGNAYIAPGNKHLELVKRDNIVRIKLAGGELVCGHKPAVDVMFASLAKLIGKNAVAAVLTGMGKDGAKGLLALHQAGAITMVQDEASCVVWGMPRAAIENRASKHIIPLHKMAKALTQAVEEQGRRMGSLGL